MRPSPPGALFTEHLVFQIYIGAITYQRVSSRTTRTTSVIRNCLNPHSSATNLFSFQLLRPLPEPPDYSHLRWYHPSPRASSSPSALPTPHISYVVDIPFIVRVCCCLHLQLGVDLGFSIATCKP